MPLSRPLPRLMLHLSLLCLLTGTSACTTLPVETDAWPIGSWNGAPRQFSQAELDQMLAPVALYPDLLLAQILIAAEFPLDIIKAARWSARYPGYSGDTAVQLAGSDPGNDWDPAVRALVAFPQLLQRMAEQLTWTERLGQAFRQQQGAVIDTVQSLRRQAYQRGALTSDSQFTVYPQGNLIAIEPANAPLIQLPWYDTATIYGPWRWGGYPPAKWAPWNETRIVPHVLPSTPAGTTMIWSRSVVVGGNAWSGDIDWRRHQVRRHTHTQKPRQADEPRPWRPAPPPGAYRYETPNGQTGRNAHHDTRAREHAPGFEPRPDRPPRPIERLPAPRSQPFVAPNSTSRPNLPSPQSHRQPEPQQRPLPPPSAPSGAAVAPPRSEPTRNSPQALPTQAPIPFGRTIDNAASANEASAPERGQPETPLSGGGLRNRQRAWPPQQPTDTSPQP